MSDDRFELVISPTARRQLTEKLPESVALAAYELIIGPLLDNPHKVGKRLGPKYRKFTSEYREEAVKMVIQTQRPTAEVARELGINEGTLGTWVNKYRNEHPVTEELSLPDRAKLKELEREVRELRLTNDFLKKTGRLLRRGAAVSDKFALIAAEQAADK